MNLDFFKIFYKNFVRLNFNKSFNNIYLPKTTDFSVLQNMLYGYKNLRFINFSKLGLLNHFY